MKIHIKHIFPANTIFYLMACICTMLFFENKAKAQPQIIYTRVFPNQLFSNPVNIKNAGDSSGRIFIVEQRGRIKIIKNGTVLAAPFLDISNKVDSATYRGLWSVAFSPNYKKNHFFFVYYVSKTSDFILSRFKVNENNPDVADANSETVLMRVSSATASGSALGEMQFGKDKYLYISMHDGSQDTYTLQNAQDSMSLYGKILRINVVAADSPYYSIPPDNPFVNTPNAMPEIWAFGLRNAWRWSFDRINGKMWLTDVGGEQRDELNIINPRINSGLNFGWPGYEGDIPFDTARCRAGSLLTFPDVAFKHDVAAGSKALIGGYVYRGKAYPDLQGYYICSDFVINNVWKILPKRAGGYKISLQQSAAPPLIESYGEDEDGELYAASLDGKIYKVGTTVNNIIAADETSGAIVKQAHASTRIFPTLVNGGVLNLDLKEAYNSFALFDLNGRELMKYPLNGALKKIAITLPELSPGMYIVHLSGKQNLEQKIFVER